MDAGFNIFASPALGRGRVVSSTLGRLYSRENHGTHFIITFILIRLSRINNIIYISVQYYILLIKINDTLSVRYFEFKVFFINILVKMP